ncbi:MAG: UDP-N-acetylmuramate--L-alanine ligase [Streptosporangiales bacterium]|nr:UDP-N-acetylmuramate--L-alanine ligase [Streptosporangiales bacterium]
MSLVKPVSLVPLAGMGRVHFIGIGGAGMSGIARVFLARGVAVSGSDAKDSAILAGLRELGADVHAGHDAAHVEGADTVVVSTAVRESNPELARARELGLRVLPRAAALGSLMLDRRGVAVAGTHGKTTTSSMLTVVLQRAGAGPGYVIGGRLMSTGLGAEDGTGEVLVAEADESDGSFLMLPAEVAVVTNVEADHLDNYAGLDEIHESFARFAAAAPLVVACADDAGAMRASRAARDAGRRVVTYGTTAGADYRIGTITPQGFGSSFALTGPGGVDLGVFRLAVPGAHNVMNAAAAIATAAELGHDPAALRDGLADFTGAARRFEPRGEARGVRVYDSYAHHPTELAADLRAARDFAGDGRVVAVFQPHLFSRTRVFAAEFGAALGLADEVVVMGIYPAREDPEPGVTGELVSRAVPHGHVMYEPTWEKVAGHVSRLARPGDVVLTMGAGDVTDMGPEIVAALVTSGG